MRSDARLSQGWLQGKHNTGIRVAGRVPLSLPGVGVKTKAVAIAGAISHEVKQRNSFMKFAKLAAAAAALAIMPAAMTAQAQEEAAPAAPASATVDVAQGANVMGNDGIAIGTVTQVTDQVVVVDTGAHQIPLPRDAFAEGDAGLTLNITKTELDASYAEQMAALAAQVNEKLVAGAPVVTADAQPLGTVDMVEGDNVVLNMAGDEKLTLGKDVFALDDNGSLMVRATKAQIDQAATGAATPEEQG